MDRIESFLLGIVAGIIILGFILFLIQPYRLGWEAAEEHYLLNDTLKYQYELQIDSTYSQID